MMNVLAISLVLTTLVTAGVFSPNPTDKKEDVIVKEGRRVVVVEYEPNEGNTKVSISPQEKEQKANAEEGKDKIKENGGFHGLNAKELVCDAFGKCKHRIASALEGTKDTISGKAHDAAEKMHEIEGDAKEAVGTAYEKVRDTVVGKAHEASEKASEVGENAKESVVKKVDEVKERTKETAEKVRTKAVDTTNTLKSHLLKNASEDLDILEAKAKEEKDKVKEDAHRLKVEGKRDYHVIRKFFSHVSAYVSSAKNFRSLMGMIHLLGFALSYGVCVWMTFISSNILARALPKQQFAMVQSKIYPAYFKTMSYGIATTFLGHYLSQKHRYYANWTEKIQGLVFLALFSMTMFNSFFVEPRATKVMRERMKLEKEEGKGKDVFDIEPSTSSVDAFKDPTGVKTGEKTTREPVETQRELSEEAARVKPQVERLSKRLKKLNVMSSGLNALSLMGLTYHLVYLSQLVHASSY